MGFFTTTNNKAGTPAAPKKTSFFAPVPTQSDAIKTSTKKLLTKKEPTPVVQGPQSKIQTYQNEAAQANAVAQKKGSFWGLAKETIKGIPQAAKEAVQGTGAFRDETNLGIVRNTITGIPKAAKEVFTPNRGFTDEQLANAKPTVKDNFFAIPKVAAEIGTSVSTLTDMIPGVKELADKAVQTKTGDFIARGGQAVQKFSKPQTAGEAKAMRFADIASFIPVGSIKSLSTAARAISSTQDAAVIARELKAAGVSDNTIPALSRELSTLNNEREIASKITDALGTKAKLAKDADIPDEYANRAMDIAIRREALDNDPLNSLARFSPTRGANKGGLPEVTGVGKSTFARRGDNIVDEIYGGTKTSEQAREELIDFLERKKTLKADEQALKNDIRELRRIKNSALPVKKASITQTGPVKKLFDRQAPINDDVYDLLNKRYLQGQRALDIDADQIKQLQKGITGEKAIKELLETSAGTETYDLMEGIADDLLRLGYNDAPTFKPRVDIPEINGKPVAIADSDALRAFMKSGAAKQPAPTNTLKAAANRYNTYEDFEMAVKRGEDKALPFYSPTEKNLVLNKKYDEVLENVKRGGYRDLRDFYTRNRVVPVKKTFKKGSQSQTTPQKASQVQNPQKTIPPKNQPNTPAQSGPSQKSTNTQSDIVKQKGSSYEDIKLDEDSLVKTSSKINVDNSGNVIPTPVRGGIVPPQLSLKSWKDKGTLRLNRETLERNLVDVAGKEDAKKLQEYIIDPVRKNEAERTLFVNEKIRAIKDMYKKLGIKVGSKADRFVQLLGEGAADIAQVEREIPRQVKQVQEAISYFRKEYNDILETVNRERARFDYEAIPKRPDYFRHFREINDIIGQFGLIFRRQELPTEIAGVTDIFKPGKPFSTAELKRLGTATDISAAKGMNNYLDSISKQMFHIDSVQRARGLERYIRDTAKHASTVAKDSSEYLELPNFVANIADYGNRLAGKKSRFDRAFESMIGRQIFGVADWLRKQTGANMIGGNIASAFTNFIPFTQSLATTNKRFAVQGLMEGLSAPFLKQVENIGDVKSSFLTRRFPENQIISNIKMPTNFRELRETVGAGVLKTGRIAGAIFDGIDRFTSRSIVSAKYYENLKKGMSPQAAMKQADEYAGKVIGDRSFGNTPNLFDNKSIGFLTQFQLEVNNLYSFLKKDIPQMSEGKRLQIVGKIAQFAVFSYLFAEGYEKVIGRRPNFDPLHAALTIAGLDSDTEDLSMGARTGKAAKALAQNIPYSSLVLQGGRIPVAAVVPNVASAIRGDTTWTEELKKPLFGLLPPFGGFQLKKTLEGLEAYNEGEVNNKTGKKAYEVEKNLTNALKMGIFGKSSVNEAREYYLALDKVYSVVDNAKKEKVKAQKEAEGIYLNLKAIAEGEGGPAEAEEMFKQLEAENPEMADLVYDVGTAEKKGLTGTDRAIKQMGAEDGTRARFIYLELLKKKSNEEKNAYITELDEKGLLPDKVYNQIAEMVKEDTPVFHTDEQMKDGGVINTIALYAKAVGTDPITAFNRIFTGQRIRRIDSDTIIIERMPYEESTKVRIARGADDTVKLDHTIPLQLGGSNSEGNLKLVPTTDWEGYTPVENYLGRLLRADKIKKKEAQRLIQAFKNGDLTFEQIKAQTQ